jgi:hypothetical protein
MDKLTADDAPERDGGWMLLKRNAITGVSEWWKWNGDGTATIRMTQDVEPILENNQALANSGNGWSAAKDMRRIASVPSVVIEEFRKRGVNLLRPESDLKAFKRIMNDSDYRKLRTADWRV